MMKYRSEIDGLRAVAVMPVIFFHAGFSVFPGGYVGVDVFFVISGFLITTIIVNEIGDGTFTLKRFYERRLRRLAPALLVVIAACIPFAWITLLPNAMDDFANSVISVFAFASNIYFWLTSGYFDTASELKPLLHTWSLAVEEQYYVVFPLLLMACWRFGLRAIWVMVAVLFVASLLASYLYSERLPDAAYFLFPFRAWEIMMGSIAALILHSKAWRTPSALADLAALVGLAMVFYAMLVFDKNTVFPGIAALLPVVGVFLIIVFSQEGRLVRTVLGFRLFVIIGLISYSLYLWHVPVFAFARIYALRALTGQEYMMLIGLTFVLAGLTWWLVEQPFRSRQSMPMGRVLAVVGGVMASLVTFAVITTSAYGLPGRDYVKSLQFREYRADNKELQQESWQILRTLSRDPGYGVANNAYDQTLWYSPNGGKKNLLVVGNSHAKDMFNVFANSDSIASTFELARYGTNLHKTVKAQSPIMLSANYKAADVVVLVSRRYRRNIEQTAKLMMQDGKTVVLLNPMHDFPTLYDWTYADLGIQLKVRDTSVDALTEGTVFPLNKAHWRAYDRANRGADNKGPNGAMLDRIAARNPNLIVLDRADFVCRTKFKVCNALGPGFRKHFYDGHHYTLDGAKFFAERIDRTRWFQPVFDRVAEAQGRPKS